MNLLNDLMRRVDKQSSKLMSSRKILRETFSKLSFLLFLSIIIAHTIDAQSHAQQGQATDSVGKNNWLVNCASSATSQQLQCQMSHSLIDKKSKRKLVSVVVRSDPKTNQLSLLLSLPHGLDLQAGVGHRVDDGKLLRAPIQTSDPNGVYAAFPISKTLMARLKGGNEFKISIRTVQQKSVVLDISLSGFTAAVSKLEKLR